MNELITREQVMTTKELAEVLGVSERTIQNTVEKLAKSISPVAKNSQGGYLFNEAQATAIKLELQNHAKVNSQAPTTDYEMELLTQRVIAYHAEKANEYKARAELAEKKNAILMHVSKTYTATEIAKECGFRSAKELNNFLEEKKIQFKINGTWTAYADYADKGYFDIKQEVLDNGKVIYYRKITQLGRDFILNLSQNC